MANEKRLIDANALSNAVAESQYYNPHPPGRVHINHINEHNHFLRMILDAPTVDAVEVVHGRWIPTYKVNTWIGICEIDGYICSECGRGSIVKGNYCPNCGAKMDGDDNA